ncbi:signal transduction histidine kinase/CheY-like chemotaxis protein/HPt (histidine-containing phosphotransfer) domain-containing protein [Haloferula luteola]|uniref:histidine kinase n=1 Tax=Haloferula luteola TaxID=595692 RepID=A0A840V3M2_9BACT|nr:ATP-binding protein [Haloferula luteola]MBB5350254.1 signal transduction histidine kinase/CheY-like chemotaxis protein/HPt (histidine-containing phosphotransfer) domain-containing protein [Haloferula luteola]
MQSFLSRHESTLFKGAFVLAGGVIVALAGFLVFEAQKWRELQYWADHSREVQFDIEEANRLLRETETAKRSLYVYGPDPIPNLPQRYQHLSGRLRDSLDNLTRQLRDNPEQSSLGHRLRDLSIQRLDDLESTFLDAPESSLEARMAHVLENLRGNDELAELFEHLHHNEESLLKSRSAMAREGTDRFLIMGGFASSAGLCAIAFAYWIHSRGRKVQLAYQGRLAEARDTALDSVKATSNFVASVSHEIRTPMNGILGASDLLRSDTRLAPDQQELVELIRRSVKSLLALINDILDLAKIQQGKIELEIKDFSLAILLDEIMALFAPTAARKELDFVYHIDPDVPSHLAGDPDRLRQALVNLVGNAVKFTESGSVTLHIGRIQMEDERPILRFTVTDTGPGIPEEQIHLLFEPFSRVNPTLASKHEGTGLGLAISRKIVHLMEGTMGVESPDSGGAQFWFTVRLHHAAVDTSTRHVIAGGGDVLVIEAREETAKSICQQLSAWNLTPHRLADPGGLESLPPPPSSSYLAVVVGGIDPHHLLRLGQTLRSLSSTKTSRLLAMVEPAQVASFQRFGTHHFDAHLKYPFRPSELFAQLNQRDSPELPAPMEKAGPFQNFKVLVVEDNPINQKLIRKQLEKLGTECRICPDGLSGVAARTGETFALVLMDCQLPDIDGFEATRRIRVWEAENGAPRTPIVAATAQVMPGFAEECFQAGMDDYLPKPFNLAKLQSVLDRWLRQDAMLPQSANPIVHASSIDCDMLLESLNSTGEIDRSLIHEGIEEARCQILLMREAHQCQNLEAWRRAAHRGKGSCLALGFVTLAKEFASSEAAPNLTQASEQLARLESALEPTQSAAQACLSSS